MQETALRANREMLWTIEESNYYEIMSSPPIWASADNQCIYLVENSKTTKSIYYFNSYTGLLSALGDDEEYQLLSDWRQVGDIKIPFDLRHYQIQLDHAVFNNTISEHHFKKPDYPYMSCESTYE